MKKRTLAALLAMVMLFTCVLSGCSGDAEPESSTPTTSESTPADDTSEPTSEGEEEETTPAAAGMTTEVGTPREETLIVECLAPTDAPGQFNGYMSGTEMSFGIHQLLSAQLWEMDTVSGEQFGDVAEDMPESNADFTEHTIKIRQGIKWSDGEDLNAEDVAFTFNMIMSNPNIGDSTYYNSVIESVEATDDYTVVVKTKESFPRLALRFGVTIWGNGFRVVPEHIYSQQEDVTTFKDSDPVVAGPYTVEAYDELGKWILYKLRDDWENTTVGVVTGKPAPDAKYIWFRYLGDDTTRQMAMINNELDIMYLVTPEVLTNMIEQNDKITAWYDDFPYATSDDPCSTGLAFSMGQGAPFDNPDFRWGIVLAMNFDDISMNIFDGMGRASPFTVLTATSAMMDFYYEPMYDWVCDFELDLGDGTTVKPFDPDYKYRIAETLRAQGYDIPEDEETLTDMFGIGWWKYDPESATKLLKKAGLELRDDGWYFEGEPFTINLTYLADAEPQASRGVEAAYNELMEFGLNCNISGESSSTWNTNHSTGNFEIAGYWPSGGITKDLYSQISGWDADLIVPLGETGSGQGTRWNNARATEIIHELATVSPDDERSYELCTEFVKIAVEDMVFVSFHAGTKFVPTNNTYWTGCPNSENPYNGPWWWWSCFKYIVPEIHPVA